MKGFGVEGMDGFEEGSHIHIRNYRWSTAFESLNFLFAPGSRGRSPHRKTPCFGGARPRTSRSGKNNPCNPYLASLLCSLHF